MKIEIEVIELIEVETLKEEMNEIVTIATAQYSVATKIPPTSLSKDRLPPPRVSVNTKSDQTEGIRW